MAKPQLLCIGAQKAGTSWLHENLKSNPGVWLPPFKELHYFDYRFLPNHRGWIMSHVKRGLREAEERAAKTGDISELDYLKSLATPPMMTRGWYRTVFSRCKSGMIGVDITPEYASIPEDGVAFVRKILGPNLRLIYIIRAPAERALSQMRMYIGRRKKLPQSEREWSDMLSEPDLLDRGNYSTHIPKWERLFQKESILYLPYGGIGRDPVSFLREIEAFSGLPKGDYFRAQERIHTGPQVKFPEFVLEKVAAMVSDQDDFLDKKFGSSFKKACAGGA